MQDPNTRRKPVSAPVHFTLSHSPILPLPSHPSLPPCRCRHWPPLRHRRYHRPDHHSRSRPYPRSHPFPHPRLTCRALCHYHLHCSFRRHFAALPARGITCSTRLAFIARAPTPLRRRRHAFAVRGISASAPEVGRGDSRSGGNSPRGCEQGTRRCTERRGRR